MANLTALQAAIEAGDRGSAVRITREAVDEGLEGERAIGQGHKLRLALDGFAFRVLRGLPFDTLGAEPLVEAGLRKAAALAAL